MGYALGIDVGAELTVAAIVGEHGRVTVLELGEGRVATASVVVVLDDGSTTVGDAATGIPDVVPAIHPMAALADTGQSENLRSLIAHVLGRAVAVAGEPPEVVGLVHPADWGADARAGLADVAREAGASTVVLVSDRVAVRHRLDETEAVAALAAGAAVAAVESFRPIVTREDFGDDRSVRLPAEDPAANPVSVFDETDEPREPAGIDPVPDSPEAAASEPPSAPISIAELRADAPTIALPAIRPSPGPRRSRPSTPRPMLIVAVVASVVLAAMVGLYLLAEFGSDGGSDLTVASSTVTTSSITTTTAPPTSSTTTTSSTTSTSTTTSTSSSTTTSTTTSSTTTVPLPVGQPGQVTLVETGLVLAEGPVMRFGDDGSTVLTQITTALGDPDSDTGFAEVAFCFSPRSRFVRWAQLEVVISEGAGGATTFTQWYVDGADDPPGLVTIDGLGVGATVGFLGANYGGTLELVPAFEGSEAGIFSVTNIGSGGSVLGITESLEPEARILEMWAGDECTRVFT